MQALEDLLVGNQFLLGDKTSVADIGVMPFVRQFAHVDHDIFYRLPYSNLQRWLEHPLFVQAMSKFKPWQEGDELVVFPA